MIEEKSVPKMKNKNKSKIKRERWKLKIENWIGFVRRIEPRLWGGSSLLLENVLVENRVK